MGLTITASQWINVAVNTLLPIVVALITARIADGAVKALVLLALSAVSGFLTSALAAVELGVPFAWDQAAFTVLLGYVVAVASHFGLWKPAAVTGSGGAVQARVPGGIGGRA